MKYASLLLRSVMLAFLATSLTTVFACSDPIPIEREESVATPAPTVNPARFRIPPTREGQWREAKRQGVVWVERELAADETRNLPSALAYGTIIKTEGPVSEHSPLGCIAIFIIGEPPMMDVQGKNTEVWKSTTVRVPSQINGEHVWKFRTHNCQPWSVVTPSSQNTQVEGSVPASEPASPSNVAFIKANLRKNFIAADITCDGERINSSEMIVCEVSDLSQFMSLLGVYDVATGSMLESYSGNYIYDGGAMTTCQGASSQSRV